MPRTDKPMTAAQWRAENPVLRQGVYGVESDTRRYRFGDGITPWNELAAFTPESGVRKIVAESGGSGGGPSASAELPIHCVQYGVDPDDSSQYVVSESVDLNDFTDPGECFVIAYASALGASFPGEEFLNTPENASFVMARLSTYVSEMSDLGLSVIAPESNETKLFIQELTCYGATAGSSYNRLGSLDTYVDGKPLIAWGAWLPNYKPNTV